MPRTKGSKNKVKADANNYEALISQAQKEKKEAEAKKIQAQEMINQLLANGMSADEILEKLK